MSSTTSTTARRRRQTLRALWAQTQLIANRTKAMPNDSPETSPESERWTELAEIPVTVNASQDRDTTSRSISKALTRIAISRDYTTKGPRDYSTKAALMIMPTTCTEVGANGSTGIGVVEIESGILHIATDNDRSQETRDWTHNTITSSSDSSSHGRSQLKPDRATKPIKPGTHGVVRNCERNSDALSFTK